MSGLKPDDRILITGGTGLIGTNLHQRLLAEGYEAVAIGSRHDLRDARVVRQVFDDYQPTRVFHLAARVGGIYANSNYKADFYSDNVLINTHVVNESVRHGIDYLFAMGTGCAYPKALEGSLLTEDRFLDGVPEVTNDAYAYAKRGLLVHLKALQEAGAMQYCYCLPANIYGPHDNYHPTHSHVVPGLIRRFHDAKRQELESVRIWGDGSAQRDFLYIEDCVDAMLLLARAGYQGPVNVATGQLTSINTLAETIKESWNYSGRIEHDLSYPTGQMERLFDTGKVRALGWRPRHSLREGMDKTVRWFESARDALRER